MFHGSIVALVTPMDQEGNIDYDSLDQLIEWHIEQGTKAILTVGTTGESGTLHKAEKKLLIEHTINRVAQRVPVIAGTHANATETCIVLAREAEQLGADACLIMTPAYIKPTQEGLYQHYAAIANEVALPQIIYNVPTRTACDILPDTLARLSKLSNIIGIKEATASLARCQEIKRKCEGLDVFSGDDNSACQLLKAGAKGVISVTANVVPHQMVKLCEYALAGKFEEMDALNAQLAPCHEMLFCESNPIPVKWVLHQMDRIGPGIRLPLTPLSDAYREPIQQMMESVGLVE